MWLGKAPNPPGDGQGPSGPAVRWNNTARGTSHPHAPRAGVKNADEAELRLLASQPLDITVHNVQDFPQLSTLAGLLSRLICQKVQGRRLRGVPGEWAGGDHAHSPASPIWTLWAEEQGLAPLRNSPNPLAALFPWLLGGLQPPPGEHLSFLEAAARGGRRSC